MAQRQTTFKLLYLLGKEATNEQVITAIKEGAGYVGRVDEDIVAADSDRVFGNLDFLLDSSKRRGGPGISLFKQYVSPEGNITHEAPRLENIMKREEIIDPDKKRNDYIRNLIQQSVRDFIDEQGNPVRHSDSIDELIEILNGFVPYGYLLLKNMQENNRMDREDVFKRTATAWVRFIFGQDRPDLENLAGLYSDKHENGERDDENLLVGFHIFLMNTWIDNLYIIPDMLENNDIGNESLLHTSQEQKLAIARSILYSRRMLSYCFDPMISRLAARLHVKDPVVPPSPSEIAAASDLGFIPHEYQMDDSLNHIGGGAPLAEEKRMLAGVVGVWDQIEMLYSVDSMIRQIKELAPMTMLSIPAAYTHGENIQRFELDCVPFNIGSEDGEISYPSIHASAFFQEVQRKSRVVLAAAASKFNREKPAVAHYPSTLFIEIGNGWQTATTRQRRSLPSQFKYKDPDSPNEPPNINPLDVWYTSIANLGRVPIIIYNNYGKVHAEIPEGHIFWYRRLGDIGDTDEHFRIEKRDKDSPPIIYAMTTSVFNETREGLDIAVLSDEEICMKLTAARAYTFSFFVHASPKIQIETDASISARENKASTLYENASVLPKLSLRFYVFLEMLQRSLIVKNFFCQGFIGKTETDQPKKTFELSTEECMRTDPFEFRTTNYDYDFAAFERYRQDNPKFVNTVPTKGSAKVAKIIQKSLAIEKYKYRIDFYPSKLPSPRLYKGLLSDFDHYY